MNYDTWKLEASPAVMYYEVEEEPVQCELCEQDATEQVDLDPVTNPGRYMVDLCQGCAGFERRRINLEIRSSNYKQY